MCEKEFQVEIIEAKRTQKVRQSVRPSGRFVNGGDFEYDPAITETTRQTMFCYTYRFLKPEECVIEYQGHTYRMPEKFTIDIYESAKYSLQGTTQGRYLTGGVPPVPSVEVAGNLADLFRADSFQRQLRYLCQ